MFLIHVRAFRDPLRGELPHVQIFINDGPHLLMWVPRCSAIDLAEIQRSSKINSWIWSIISGVITVLGLSGRGASQVGNSPCLHWATQILTVAYDDACSSNVCQNGVNYLQRLALQEKNLIIVRVLMLLKWRTSPDMLLFSLCNEKRLAIRHMNRPFFPKTPSIPSYDITK